MQYNYWSSEVYNYNAILYTHPEVYIGVTIQWNTSGPGTLRCGAFRAAGSALHLPEEHVLTDTKASSQCIKCSAWLFVF